jgi:hypothetical protein
MTGVLSTLRHRRRGLLRWVAMLLLAAEAVGIVVAPSAEAVASRSAPAHVEAGGTHLHHSHIPETCAACIALQITGLPIRHEPPEPPAPARQEPRPVVPLDAGRAIRAGPNSPRAPPILPRAA